MDVLFNQVYLYSKQKFKKNQVCLYSKQNKKVIKIKQKKKISV